MPQASAPLHCIPASVLQDGLDINGMEGTLVEVIEKYQGKTLSANLPYKTQFMIPKDDGSEMKLIVHLVRKSAASFAGVSDSQLCSSSPIPGACVRHDSQV